MLRSRLYSHLTAVAVLTLAIGFAQVCGVALFQQVENSVQDRLVRIGRPAKIAPDLVFLARDTKSANLETIDVEHHFDLSDADAKSRRALNLMAQEWPWSREVYALVLDRLMNAGARAVAFDMTFPKPSPQDDSFKAELDRYGDRVVVAGNFTEDRNGAVSTFSAPTATLVPQTSLRDPRIGFDNFWTDPDGIVRQAQYRWAIERGVWQGNEELSLAARILEKSGFSAAVPPDRQSHRLRLAGPPETFGAVSIHEIFVPKYWEHNFANGAFFRNKIIVIGAAGNWQHDEHQTSLGLMSGPELQLNSINAAINGEFLRVVPWQSTAVICLVAGAAALLICLYCASPLFRVGLVLAIVAGWGGTQLFLFNRNGLFVPIVGPVAILSLSGIFSITYDLIWAGAEHLRLRRAIHERKRAQELLQTTNEELERRVEERTIELSNSNASLTRLLEEKSVLLKEIHHRVKNNLQTISSLLNLQSANIKDPDALQLFTETRYRVRSMALIHEKLYQSSDLARIDFADYLRSLTSGLASSFAGAHSGVHLSVDAEEIMLAVDSAVPCGLIVNELVTNSFKYAFAGGRSGVISIRMERAEGSNIRLSVADDGVGFPKGVDFRDTESLGMQLVTSLTEQLDGNVELLNGTGTKFVITFPEGTN